MGNRGDRFGRRLWVLIGGRRSTEERFVHADGEIATGDAANGLRSREHANDDDTSDSGCADGKDDGRKSTLGQWSLLEMFLAAASADFLIRESDTVL